MEKGLEGRESADGSSNQVRLRPTHPQKCSASAFHPLYAKCRRMPLRHLEDPKGPNSFISQGPGLIQHPYGIRQTQLKHIVWREEPPLVLPPNHTVHDARVGLNDHDAAIGVLRQTVVLAAAVHLHVEDWDVRMLGRDGRKAQARVARHE